MNRVKEGEFSVGKPLNHGVYDDEGVLLLCEGYVITSDSQLKGLLERGMYHTAAPKKPPKPATDIKQNPFDTLAEIGQRLGDIQQLLLTGQADMPRRFLRLAQDLQRLCDLDTNAGLAAIHLCHFECYTIYHPLHQAILCEMVGRARGHPADQRMIVIAAALTANIGMHELQDTLTTQAEPLTAEQKQAIQAHPKKSVEILEAAGVTDKLWLKIVLQHHERVDGKGYPHRLSSEQICDEASMLAVADRYSAMVSPRSYREPISAQEALRNFFMSKGTEYHEELSLLCIKELGIFPPGSFVRLVNGEVAVVTHRDKAGGMFPLVSSVFSPRGGPYANPLRRNSAQAEYAIKETCVPEQGLKLNLHSLWGYN